MHIKIFHGLRGAARRHRTYAEIFPTGKVTCHNSNEYMAQISSFFEVRAISIHLWSPRSSELRQQIFFCGASQGNSLQKQTTNLAGSPGKHYNINNIDVDMYLTTWWNGKNVSPEEEGTLVAHTVTFQHHSFFIHSFQHSFISYSVFTRYILLHIHISNASIRFSSFRRNVQDVLYCLNGSSETAAGMRRETR
ncbi:hypothetical protein ANN_15601 [Periplaneta americana]|uniref:Uncharacterized protein n=1 Tax=Periplaneta americana TaxID=6978 RepID=A0ABQ8SI64_PERAM|nr:hypothetical protein ANN_15601 [Periplaneta americana]